jgi:hypothetical protein
MKALVAFLSVLVTVPVAWADVVYSYTGNNYTVFQGSTFNASESVTGSLTFSSPLADQALSGVSPLSASFSNGQRTFGLADAHSIQLQIAGGLITGWIIQFEEGSLNLPGDQEFQAITRSDFADEGLFERVTSNGDVLDFGIVARNPGTWTVTNNSVPEPNSVALVFTALGVGWFASRKKWVAQKIATLPRPA